MLRMKALFRLQLIAIVIILPVALTLTSGATLAAGIHEAAGNGDLEAVRKFLDQDPDLIDAADGMNWTPLFHAADAGEKGIVIFLLDKGADVNRLDGSKRGPIFRPAFKGDDGMVELLLDRGADPMLEDVRGNSPIYWAAVRKHKSTVGLFSRKGYPVSIHEAAACGDVELMGKALENGERPGDRNHREDTAMHLAVNGGQLEALEYLIEAGADLGIMDSNGQTPLDLAVERGQERIVSFLESKGYRQTPVIDPDIVVLSGGIRRFTFPYHMHTNIVVQTGPDGILIVDTGFSKRAATRLKREIASLQGGEITCLVNSHEHWDHVAGNFIAGGSTKKISLSVIEDFLAGGSSSGDGRPLSRIDQAIAGRTGKGFEYFYSMDFNGEEIRLIPYPGIHSDNDVLTHFTGSNVVHMGDLLLSQSFPAIGNIPAYLEFLDTVIDVFPDETIFVSGHGTDLTREGVMEYRRMLETTVDMVRVEMAKGKSIDEVNEAGILDEYGSYGELLTFLAPDSWVRRIFRSYE